MTAVDVRRLSVSYGSVRALHDVDLTCSHGNVTGLIGPNGAGKSTLLRSIMGLVTPDAGSVRIEGRPPSSASRGLAYLPQRSTIDADYPIQVRDLVALGRLPHLGLLQRNRPEDHEAIAEAIERVGLSGLERRMLGRLSGGQQQRAHVARALAQQATVYIFDEPFAGVDAPTIDVLVSVMRELAAGGAAVLIVIHDLALIEAMCDEVVVINRTLVAHGTVAQVLAGPTFSDPWLMSQNQSEGPTR